MFKYLSTCVTLIFLSFNVYANAISTPLSDAAITTYLKSKMATTSSIPASDVHVTTTKGTVYLSGVVPTDEDASKVVELVQSTNGVKQVNTDKLKVETSKHPYSDTMITAKVKGLYLREKLFSEKDLAALTIHVETKNGVVYLTGKADNKQQIQNAIATARKVEGVKSVDSKVTIHAPVTSSSAPKTTHF